MHVLPFTIRLLPKDIITASLNQKGDFMPLPANANRNEIAHAAMAAVQEIAPRGNFNITSLFPKDEWDSFNPVERREAGKIFKKYIMAGSAVSHEKIDSANLNHYKR
jgi:hypothetical protein